MKSLLVALVLVSSPAFAAWDSSSDDLQVSYISWCDDNKVMGETSQGQVYVRQDCTQLEMTCKALQSYRLHQVIYTATCQPQP